MKADAIYEGKQWHSPRKAFRPGSGITSYEQRAKSRVATAATKAKEKEMKEEKEAERQVRRPGERPNN
jgi:rRNA-processing protein CGR1